MTAAEMVPLLGLLGGLGIGLVAQKTGFCTRGAISDVVFDGDTGRLRAWFVAIAVALIGAQILHAVTITVTDDFGEAITRPIVDLADSIYRTSTFAWLSYFVGGTLFGIGMSLGTGCGNKILLRVGGGNLRALVVLMVMAITAAATLWGFLGVHLRVPLESTAVELEAYGMNSQAAHVVLAHWLGMSEEVLRWVLTGLVGGGLILYAFLAPEFRKRPDNVVSGFLIGLFIVFGWWVTGYYGVVNADPLGGIEPTTAASYTFTAPLGESLRYLMLTSAYSVNFGIAAVVGVVLGAFIWSVVSGKFRWEYFTSLQDMANHVIGGALMGVGGVLALGCTFGQGITGISTLSLGSFIALAGIFFGSVLTMKVEFYKMVHGKDTNWFKSLVESLADMRLLPDRVRMLD
ncbi:YeeE/YedE family protein [Thiohalobacter sp.]|uniref:YeeE/YedE family protein n=1 Tax=Thiohalobacter sp. TaxID=2025948 RepID=UPI002626B7A9|nr:YeeE/YedE family protein [Thiohalobacter sp.]